MRIRLNPRVLACAVSLASGAVAVALLRSAATGGASPAVVALLSLYGGGAILLAGIGLFGAEIGTRVAVPAGGGIMLLGSTLLAQLLAGRDMGLQYLLRSGRISPASIQTESAAVITAVVVIIIGAGLISSPQKGRWSGLVSGVAGASAAATGLTGTILSFAAAGRAARYAVPVSASLGFGLVGLLLIWRAWRAWDPTAGDPAALFTTVVAVASGVMSLIIWQAAVATEHNAIEARAQLLAARLGASISRDLELQGTALGRFAKLMKESGLSYRRPPGLITLPSLISEHIAGVGWLDSSLRLRWMLPSNLMDDLSEMRLPSLGEASKGAANSELIPFFSPYFSVPAGAGALFVCLPVPDASRSDGAVVGLLRPQDLLAASVQRLAVTETAVLLTEKTRAIGQLPLSGLPPDDGVQGEATVRVGALLWQLRVRPTANWVRQQRTSIPFTVLALGLLSTVVITALIDRAQRYHYGMERAVAGSEELAAEVETGTKERALLHATEHRFRSSMQHLPAGFGIFRAIRGRASEITDFRVDYLNDAGARALGLQDMEVTGRCLSEVLPGYRSSPVFLSHKSVVEKGQPVSSEQGIEAAGHRGNLLVRFTRLSDGFTAVWLDVTEERRVEEARRDLETRFRAFFMGVPVALYRTGPTGEILEANPALVRLLRCPDFDTLRAVNTSAFFIDPAARAEQREMLSETGVVRGFELRVMCYDGASRWLRDTCRAVSDEQGQVLYYEGMLEDITDQREADEQLRASLREKELLLKEVHHRVKNNLQVISSLLSLQSDSVSEMRVRAMFTESQDRVRSMAMVHERLYQSPDLASIDFSEYVQSLVSHLHRAYASVSRSVATEVDIPSCSMGVDEAISCGLVINELVSNSLKHGFPVGRSGRAWVRLDVRSDTCLLEVGDDGIGLPQGFVIDEAATLGLRLVSTLADQLEGRLAIVSSRGTVFQLTFPRAGSNT